MMSHTGYKDTMPSPPCPLFRRAGEGETAQGEPPFATIPLSHPAGKGTTVRHEVFEAGAIFPSASVNGQARLFALTPFVPLSRRRERGNALQGAPPCVPTPLVHSVGEGERAAGRTAVRPYTSRPQRGRGAGVRATKMRTPPHAANSSDVPLSGLSPTLWERGRRAPTVLEC